MAKHSAALIFVATIGLLLTNPLPGWVDSAVIGAGAGDNIAFVWNFWWAKAASSTDRLQFWTSMMFAPSGTSLVMHTLTPLLLIPSALLIPDAQPVTAYNVAVIVCVILNGSCTYILAYFITRDRLASLFAGLTFSAAPFLIIRLEGHLNVLSAWVLPLVALVTVWFSKNPTRKSATMLGAVFGCVAYVDYYYLVFSVFLILGYLALSTWSIQINSRALTNRRRAALIGFGGVIASLLMLGIWIEYTGGVDL